MEQLGAERITQGKRQLGRTFEEVCDDPQLCDSFARSRPKSDKDNLVRLAAYAKARMAMRSAGSAEIPSPQAHENEVIPSANELPVAIP